MIDRFGPTASESRRDRRRTFPEDLTDPGLGSKRA